MSQNNFRGFYGTKNYGILIILLAIKQFNFIFCGKFGVVGTESSSSFSVSEFVNTAPFLS